MRAQDGPVSPGVGPASVSPAPSRTDGVSKSRRIAVNLLLTAVSVMLAMAAGEVALRLFAPPPPIVSIVREPDLDRHLADETREARHVDMTPNGAWKQLFVRTPTGRRMHANMSVRIVDHELSHQEIEIRTNSLGYRNPEVGPKTRTRVLFLGDSITMAHYLREEETFVRGVEVLSARSERPLETINAGIAAAGLQQELAILMETGLRTDPDVVVVDFYLNDVQTSPGIVILRPPHALAWSRVAQYAAVGLSFLWAGRDDENRGEAARLDPALLSTWRKETERRLPPGPGDPVVEPAAFHRLVLENFNDWGSAWSDGAWEVMRPLFEELRRQSDAHHFRLAFVAFPVRPQVEADVADDEPQRRLRELATTLGVPMLDLLPALRRARPQSLQGLFYDVCHPTSAGHAVIAREIAAFLERDVLRHDRPGR